MKTLSIGMKVVFVGVLLAACEDAEGAGLEAAHHDGHFAVVSTNYTGATTVSLLGDDGEVVDAEWIGSKTKNPELRTPLTEDVVLPTVSFSRRYLTLIERGLGVVTRVDLDDGKVLGQVRTDESPEEDMAAYRSNPQDVYYVDEESAWVSRWAQNPDSKAPASEQGTDLIEFDPSTMKRTDRRIDLSELSIEIEEEQYDENFEPIGKVMSTAHASPATLVPVGDFLAVGLARLTASYNYGPGALAIVDPIAAKLIDTLDLKELSNCGDVRPVVGEESEVLVQCQGAFGDGGIAAGIVRVAVDGEGKAKVVGTFRVADHEGAANTNSSLTSLGGDQVASVAAGSLDSTTGALIEPDVLYRVDLKTGKQVELWTSEGAYSLGIPAFDPETGVLLVPDAGGSEEPIYGTHRFIVGSDMTIEDDGFVKVAPGTTLAAREVRRL